MELCRNLHFIIRIPDLAPSRGRQRQKQPAFSTHRSKRRNKLAASDPHNGPCPWRERNSSAQPRGNLRRTIRERKIHSDSNSDSCEYRLEDCHRPRKRPPDRGDCHQARDGANKGTTLTTSRLWRRKSRLPGLYHSTISSRRIS